MAVYLTDIQGALHTRLSGQSPFVAAVINNGGGYPHGATSLTVDPLPVDIASSTLLTFSGGAQFMVTSSASKDATTLTGFIGLSGTPGTVADNESATVAYSAGLVLEDDDVQSKMEALLNRVRGMALVLRPISMIRVLEKTVVDFNWEVDCIENPAVNRPTGNRRKENRRERNRRKRHTLGTPVAQAWWRILELCHLVRLLLPNTRVGSFSFGHENRFSFFRTQDA